MPESLFKKSCRLWHRSFPVNFVKFLRTPFLQNTSGQLLLDLVCFKGFLIMLDVLLLWVENVVKKLQWELLFHE